MRKITRDIKRLLGDPEIVAVEKTAEDTSEDIKRTEETVELFVKRLFRKPEKVELINGGCMNEKDNFSIVIILVIVAIAFGGATGYLVGRGNPVGHAGLEHSNRELTAANRELRTELYRERAITERFGVKQAEERAIIRDALYACGRTGEGIQGVIRKMEILNALIRELEYRADGGGDLSGGE